MRLALIIFSLAFVNGMALAQQAVENLRHGYTIDIPDGWHEVPSDFLTEFGRSVSAPGQSINYVAGYQETPFEDALVYPYVLIQSIAYRDFGLNRPPTNDEMGDVVKAILGMDITEALEGTAAADVAEPVDDNPPISLVSFDNAAGVFVYDLNIAVADVGDVRGRARGEFGFRALMQPAFFALQPTWTELEPQANTLLESFEFWPDYAYPEKDSSKASEIELEGMTEYEAPRSHVIPIVLGGIAILVFALAAFLGVRLIRENKTRSQSD